MVNIAMFPLESIILSYPDIFLVIGENGIPDDCYFKKNIHHWPGDLDPGFSFIHTLIHAPDHSIRPDLYSICYQQTIKDVKLEAGKPGVRYKRLVRPGKACIRRTIYSGSRSGKNIVIILTQIIDGAAKGTMHGFPLSQQMKIGNQEDGYEKWGFHISCSEFNLLN